MSDVRIGNIVELEITKVAHGGICIARYDGKVVFVRLGLPGEKVRAEITDITTKFLRATVVEVIIAHAQRISAPCSYARVCGGCDWQHASIDLQRELKSDVVREQLTHAFKSNKWGSVDGSTFSVEPIGDGSAEGWRTRMRFAKTSSGGLGMRGDRSHELVAIDSCLIAASGLVELAQKNAGLAADDVSVVSSSTGQMVAVDERGGPWVDEQVHDRRWRIHASSFWQIHRAAPQTFVDVVREFAQLKPGESLLDLYSGAALFSASLAADVGDHGFVVAVESNVNAVRDARRSCSDVPNLELVTASVDKWIKNCQETFDVVVLDPPRTGAGADVCKKVATLAQRSIVYVACDPSALARDAVALRDAGWTMSELRGFDAFPMTHHLECIALFTREN